MLNAVLRNYRAIEYFTSHNLVSSLKVWLRYDRVHIVSFHPDILQLLKTFQKACQADNILIATPMWHHCSLEKCKTNCLEGGWEQHFLESIVTNGNEKLLNGITVTASDTKI